MPRYLSDHVRKNRDRWFRRAREIGYTKILPDDIIFINGYVKTRLWALGAIPSVRREFGPGLEIIVKGEMTDAAKRLLDMTEVSRPCYARSGPNVEEQRMFAYEGINRLCDQAIFLSYFKTKTRLLAPLQVKAYAQPCHLPNLDKSGGSGVLSKINQRCNDQEIPPRSDLVSNTCLLKYVLLCAEHSIGSTLFIT